MRAWFILLFSTICLEGLGRKYLPQIPSVAFYFLKDIVLVAGFLRFRPTSKVKQAVRHLYGGFGLVWVVAFAWTALEVVNPEQQSFLLGLIGLRAYWLWWFAPALIATVLQNETSKRRGIQILLAMATIVSLFAMIQFASPPTSQVNLYSVVDGEQVYADQTMVATTGRARVASTFSFLTGFQDFTILVPALLLSIGLDAKDPKLRRSAFAITLLSAAVVPMSGSRTSVLLGGAVLAVTVWSAGLFFTRTGRRILVGAVLATVLAMGAFPDAFIGVQSRFEDKEETNSRYQGATLVLPPVALWAVDYPFLGIGTGSQQNARASMHISSQWDQELEEARYLVELGPIGFLLVWTAKFGLIVALWRSYKILKNAGRRGAASAALSYAILTANGSLTFDHIWQALYFTGCGFILAEVVNVRTAHAKMGLAPALVTPADATQGTRAPGDIAAAVSQQALAGAPPPP